MSPLDQDRWQKISPLLDRALSLSGTDRAAWIESLRTEDPELASQLQALLNEHSVLAREGFLENRPLDSTSGAAAPGQSVGAYTLISILGQGGMGTVWLAERSDGRFERRVAVKFLRFTMATQPARERFQSEGRILGQLAHPHIAELIDAGVTATAEPYLVLEHVEGEPIDDYCDDHKLDLNARIELFLDVLSAVSQAHANLIVHRDIKPSNVLVRNDGQVKLLDFGIAKLLDAENAEGTLVTGGGGPLTPQFAAPEQMNGRAITTATDVYSLGVLLYILLTGQHPAGSGPRSAVEMVRSIVETEAPRASHAIRDASSPAPEKRGTTMDKLRRQLRGDLDTILAKALKKDPRERYSSVTALADDLRRYLKNEPIGARPDSMGYRTVKFVRRNRTAVALTALVLIAILAGTAATLIQTRNARRQRDLALDQLRQAAAVSEFTTFLISEASPNGKPFTIDDLLTRADNILTREHGTLENRVPLMASIGMEYSLEDNEKKARPILEAAYKLSKTSADPSARAVAACSLASAVNRGGDRNYAETLVQEGLHDLPEDPEFALDRVECLRRGTEIAEESGNSRQAIERMKLAQQVIQQSPLDSDWIEMVVSLDLGEAYRTAGQAYEASQVFEQVNSLAVALGRDQTQEAGVLYNDWGLTLETLGRSKEAEALFQRDISLNSDGGSDAGVPPVVFNNYAITLRYMGRLADAAANSERAYDNAVKEGDQFTVYRALHLRSLIYSDEHDYTRAAEMLNELEPLVQKHFAPGSVWFGLVASDEAFVASGQGDAQRALALSDRSIALIHASMQSGGQGSDLLPGMLINRSKVELAAQQAAKAADDASQAVQLMQAVGRPGALSSHVAIDYVQLGKSLQAEGKTAEAHAAFRSAVENFADTLGADQQQTVMAHQLADATSH
jgi:serine/threonine protein kinase